MNDLVATGCSAIVRDRNANLLLIVIRERSRSVLVSQGSDELLSDGRGHCQQLLRPFRIRESNPDTVPGAWASYDTRNSIDGYSASWVDAVGSFNSVSFYEPKPVMQWISQPYSNGDVQNTEATDNLGIAAPVERIKINGECSSMSRFARWHTLGIGGKGQGAVRVSG